MEMMALSCREFNLPLPSPSISSFHPSRSAWQPVCVSKTSSVLMRYRNRLVWRDDRVILFRSGYIGLGIQVEEAA
jgi:hypothetical protein